MRFGNWRGMRLVLRVTTAAGLAFAMSSNVSKAQDFHTIPRLTPAIDLNTGSPYYAPPVPYGHYAGSNLGGKIGGHLHGLFGGLGGKLHGLKSGLGGHGAGLGHGHGLGMGHGHGFGLLGKLKGHGHGDLGHGFGHHSTVMPTEQNVVLPAPQGVTENVCGHPGCGIGFPGCGNGCGLLSKLKSCSGCGGKGCGMCGGLGHMGDVHGLLGKVHGKIGGAIAHLTGAGNIKWFNGPGGPVPLTPGYVPYINPVRSPRDFFAFPPMSEGTSGLLPIQASYNPPTAVSPTMVPAPTTTVPVPPAPAVETRELPTPPAPEAVPAPAPESTEPAEKPQ